MPMSQFDPDIDPNAPTANQVALKRVEAAIRKRADCGLLMQLDAICLLTDPVQIQQELARLTQKIAHK
jgi:hypothetical protein